MLLYHYNKFIKSICNNNIKYKLVVLTIGHALLCINVTLTKRLYEYIMIYKNFNLYSIRKQKAKEPA